MKLELHELTTALAKKAPQAVQKEGIKAISPDKPFLQGFVENVSQVMNVLDSMGIKDLFIEKAREELQDRLFRRMTTHNPSNPMKGERAQMLKGGFDLEKIISLGLVWIDKFIEKNGDMPLSQFRKEIEANKADLVKIIKSLGIGL